MGTKRVEVSRKGSGQRELNPSVFLCFTREFCEWVVERLFFCCREGPSTKYGKLADHDEDEGCEEADGENGWLGGKV